MRSDAFCQGFDANRRGDDPELNPFDERDAQWDEWEDGWYTAHIEAALDAEKGEG